MYRYPDVPKDVYRRHTNCGCTVEYIPKDGKIQNVWSKLLRRKEQEKKIEEIIEKTKLSDKIDSIKKDIRRLDISKATPSDIIKLGEKVNKQFQVYNHIGDKEKLKEIFSNFREMGGIVPKETWAKGSSRIVKSQLEEAFSYYPKDWALIPQKHNKQLQTKKVQRGYFQRSRDMQPLVIATNGIRKTTPYHEIGHMVEYSNPDLVRLEKDWVNSRTEGENYTRLNEIFPNIGFTNNEVVKKDDFISPYIGKYYDNAAEVLTMGLQGLYELSEKFSKSWNRATGNHEWKTIHDDPEFLNFTIGLLLKG